MRVLISLSLLTFPALAEVPEVVGATARASAGGWSFDVTLRHPDTGWDHYADAWRVETPDGSILGVRELVHPHVDEQLFTRSLSDVTVPDGADHVLIRARCLLDGWSDKAVRLDLP